MGVCYHNVAHFCSEGDKLVEVTTISLSLETSGTARPNTWHHITESGILKLIFDSRRIPRVLRNTRFHFRVTRVSADRLQYHSAVHIYVLDLDCTSYKNSVSSLLCSMRVRGTFYWTCLWRLGSVEKTDFPGKVRSVLPLTKNPAPWSWYMFINFIS
jgi:hypothetical protein